MPGSSWSWETNLTEELGDAHQDSLYSQSKEMKDLTLSEATSYLLGFVLLQHRQSCTTLQTQSNLDLRGGPSKASQTPLPLAGKEKKSPISHLSCPSLKYSGSVPLHGRRKILGLSGSFCPLCSAVSLMTMKRSPEERGSDNRAVASWVQADLCWLCPWVPTARGLWPKPALAHQPHPAQGGSWGWQEAYCSWGMLSNNLWLNCDACYFALQKFFFNLLKIGSWKKNLPETPALLLKTVQTQGWAVCRTSVFSLLNRTCTSKLGKVSNVQYPDFQKCNPEQKTQPSLSASIQCWVPKFLSSRSSSLALIFKCVHNSPRQTSHLLVALRGLKKKVPIKKKKLEMLASKSPLPKRVCQHSSSAFLGTFNDSLLYSTCMGNI